MKIWVFLSMCLFLSACKWDSMPPVQPAAVPPDYYYVDVTPDTILCAYDSLGPGPVYQPLPSGYVEYFAFDVTEDGVNDIQIKIVNALHFVSQQQGYFYTSEAGFLALNSEFAVRRSGMEYFTLLTDSGEVISNAGQYETAGTIYGRANTGQDLLDEKYIVFKQETANSGSRLGWIRIRRVSTYECAVVEYAFDRSSWQSSIVVGAH